MLDGFNRMIPHHARTCIAHGFTHLLLHIWLIAMDSNIFFRQLRFREHSGGIAQL